MWRPPKQRLGSGHSELAFALQDESGRPLVHSVSICSDTTWQMGLKMFEQFPSIAFGFPLFSFSMNKYQHVKSFLTTPLVDLVEKISFQNKQLCAGLQLKKHTENTAAVHHAPSLLEDRACWRQGIPSSPCFTSFHVPTAAQPGLLSTLRLATSLCKGFSHRLSL